MSASQTAAGPPLSEADLPQLLQLLQAALSTDAAAQKQAEAVLTSLEARTGFCSCLAAVVGNAQADHSARWLAAVQLKNSVNKHWRPRYDRGGLSPEEKAYLRGAFLQLIPQEDNQIAVQVALLLAKAARFDFPQQWPSLFSDLLAGLGSAQQQGGGQQQQQQGHAAPGGQQQQLLVRRTYFVMHHVLKELSSKRLAADQRAFAEVTQLLFDHVWHSWASLLADILAGLPAGLAAPSGAAPSALLLAFERWLLLLKILRRLLVFGFPSDAKSLQPVPAVAHTAPQLLAAVAALQAARPQQPASAGSGGGGPLGRNQLLAMVDRGLLKLIKTLSQVQQEHPWSFHHAGVLLPLLEACCAQLMAAAGGGPFSPAREALLTACVRALLGVLSCDAYAGKAGGASGERAAAIKQLSSEASAQLKAWWASPAAPPQLPALSATLAAAGGHGGGAAGAGNGVAQPQAQLSRAGALLQGLVAGYFPLSGRDLEEWSADGEAWAHSHADATSSADTLRPCCQQLALRLLMSDRPALAPVLVALLRGVSALVPPGWGVAQQAAAALPGPAVAGPGGASYPLLLLLKEGVYEAVGLCAYELHDHVDYTGWLHAALLPEMSALQQQQPQQHQQQHGQAAALLPLLPRAAARLVGQWVADLKPADRPAAYAALALLLVQPAAARPAAGKHQAPGPDVVLQLAAVAALRVLVDDFGFEGPAFVGVLPAVMGALVDMLQASEELDTQTQVFGLMNLIIDRLGSDITPHVGGLLPLLPQAWHAAADQSLLRIQVLCCLSLLVNVLGPDSVAAYPLLLPLLREALQPGSSQPELLEDGLCLWLVALRNAPSAEAGAPLLELSPALAACLANSTEHITIGMQLLSSLLLLGGGPFLATYGGGLLDAVSGYVGNVVERGLLLTLPPVDLLLVAAPAQAAPLLQPFMQRLLGLLLSGQESGLLVANALLLFARLLLQHQPGFEQLLGSAAAAGLAPGQQGPLSAEALLLALLGVWLEAFDSIAQPLARKLAAAGLLALLGLPVKGLLHQLPPLLSHVASVWLELEASGADDPSSERGQLLYGGGLWSGGAAARAHEAEGGWDEPGGLMGGLSLITSEEAAGEAARRQALREAEPLRHVRLSRMLAEKLAAAAALHGSELQAAMAALDPAISQQVQAVLAAADAKS